MIAPPRGSACGKAILIGEHAVVHGVPALAIPVDRRLQVILGPEPAPELHPEFATWFATVAAEATGQRWYPAEVVSELPRGAGLGSSAALVVASLRAIAPRAGWSSERLLELADAGERIFHGNPSGVDVRTVLFERPLRFQRGAELSVAPAALGGRWSFAVWSTPPGPPTATMVARVSAALERAGRERALAEAAELVARAEAALRAGEPEVLGQALVGFHRWLARHEASTAQLDALVERALAHGALGAKLTGAGGGGALLVLEPPGRSVPAPADVSVLRFTLTG